MRHFLEDVTLGQILAAIIAVFTCFNLILSGRVIIVIRRARKMIEKLAGRIGHPDPRHVTVSGGKDLYEKLEWLEDVIRPVVERDLVYRLREDTPGPGRRRTEGEQTDG